MYAGTSLFTSVSKTVRGTGTTKLLLTENEFGLESDRVMLSDNERARVGPDKSVNVRESDNTLFVLFAEESAELNESDKDKKKVEPVCGKNTAPVVPPLILPFTGVNCACCALTGGLM